MTTKTNQYFVSQISLTFTTRGLTFEHFSALFSASLVQKDKIRQLR